MEGNFPVTHIHDPAPVGPQARGRILREIRVLGRALLVAGLASIGTQAFGAGKPAGPHVLDAVPKGYHLHACDDCGVADRQPHVLMADSYLWTFNPSDTDADLKSRSAVFSYKSIRLHYTNLDPNRSYVLALTYASDHVYRRVQSLWADGVELHAPLELPKAKATRVVVKVPQDVTRDGVMNLELRIHGEVNATVSVVELWADAPPAHPTIRIEGLSGLVGDLSGQVLDLAYDPAPDTTVRLFAPGATTALATATTGADGVFRFRREDFAGSRSGVRLVARKGTSTTEVTVPASELSFQPVRYRPAPVAVAGLDVFQQSLDGTWQIHPEALANSHEKALASPGWKPFRVPGQWREQGFDLPRDRPVAMAREFDVPADWAGKRAILHFEAIHAGTRYRINGILLGTSENLFTPVQWDITALVKPGRKNRIDLEMKVDTTSETLSFSSNYAFHSLGGIDRSVRLFALPDVNVRSLGIQATLDGQYRNGRLDLTVGLENTRAQAAPDSRLRLSLIDPVKSSEVAATTTVSDRLEPGEATRRISLPVNRPRHWTAETPELYQAILELEVGGKVVERVERAVGFRTVEVRGSQVLLNGVPIKLAGACRHEVEPLSGRADTAKLARHDVELLKGANLNFIRTSHYPPTIELVDAADRLGMYLEVEAPCCWVGVENDMKVLREVLTPTSAMVDYYQSHPSVLDWSLANESNFNRCFEVSNQLVKQLDPTRPTDFNNPDPKRVCDLGNIHYPAMPYDAQASDDPRPLVFGEYDFPVCHEQTDVRINPGLREFFGAGHSDPGSAWGRACAESFTKPYTKPCIPPGAWSHIVASRRVTGGAIFAAFDDSFYFPDGTHAGYAWHHGFWGLVDGWRRTKPEWWMTKMVFSPVWFPQRVVEMPAPGGSIRIPVENRYAFTDLSALRFRWRLGGRSATTALVAQPGGTATIEIPAEPREAPGTPVEIRVVDRSGTLVTAAAIPVGHAPDRNLAQPGSGPLKVERDGPRAVLTGDGFSLVVDMARGEFVVGDSRHNIPLRHFPVPHLTRYDFGDLAGPDAKPYTVLPDLKTRRFEQIEINTLAVATEIVVHESYDVLEGRTSLTLDRSGRGVIRYDHVYRGDAIDTREAGVRLALAPALQTFHWRRWAEWGVYPDDSISRPTGTAVAFRPGTHGPDREGVRPAWPWSQDQTELGTADFRSIKFHIYEAELDGNDGSGLRVEARADRHVRACVADGGVLLHILTRCPLGQVTLRRGDRLQGDCVVQVIPRR